MAPSAGETKLREYRCVRLFIADGELDADFSISAESDQGGNFSVVLESRGGDRNPDYADALETLLRAIGVGRMQVVCIEVCSTQAQQLPASDRRLGLDYPLKPNPGTDLSDLRKEISRLQIPIAQRPGAKGGNSTKRIRLHVTSDDHFDAGDFRKGVLPSDGWLRRQAFVMTWNPKNWSWDNRDTEVRRSERGKTLKGRWTTGNTESGIRGGDLVFLLRQGSSNRGIVGVGTAVGTGECVFEDEHWDDKRAKRGDKANCIEVSWQRLVNDSDRIPIEVLKTQFSGYGWSWDRVLASGWRLPAAVARDLLNEIDSQLNHQGGNAPEVKDAKETIDFIAGRSSRGQGFRLSAAQRSVIEKHSMALARKHLKNLGCTGITDTSQGNPYDFSCTSWNGRELFIEVKGTTSNAGTLVLTRNEVELHRKEYPDNALLVVHGITLSGPARDKAEGGTVWFVQPWEIEDSALRVIAYNYSTADLPPEEG